MVSQREQVLVVPMMHLEDVRKNITEAVTAETDADGLTFTDIQSFTEDGEDGYANLVKCEQMLYWSYMFGFYFFKRFFFSIFFAQHNKYFLLICFT